MYGSGYGDGSGYGSGSGYGDGKGNGYGTGYGYGTALTSTDGDGCVIHILTTPTTKVFP